MPYTVGQMIVRYTLRNEFIDFISIIRMDVDHDAETDNHTDGFTKETSVPRQRRCVNAIPTGIRTSHERIAMQ